MAPKKASAVAKSLAYINAAAADDSHLGPLDTAAGLKRHRDRLVYRAGAIGALEQTQEAERVRLEAEQVRQDAEKVRLRTLAENLDERERKVTARELQLQSAIDEWNAFVATQPPMLSRSLKGRQ